MAVLLTRPQADSQRIADKLADRGIASLIWPLTRVRRLAESTTIAEGTDALLFTSANAVRAFAELSGLRDIPAFCVGKRTTQVAQDLGFTKVTNADGDAAALLEIAVASPYRQFHYPRGRETAWELAKDIRAQGKQITEETLYGSDPAGPRRHRRQSPVVGAVQGRSLSTGGCHTSASFSIPLS